MSEQCGPHQAGQVTPEMEVAFDGTITLILTATAKIDFAHSNINRAAARRVAEDRTRELIAEYKAATRTPWASKEEWDFEIDIQGAR